MARRRMTVLGVFAHPADMVAEANLTRDPVGLHRSYSRGADLWRIPREPSPTDRHLRPRAPEGRTP